MHYYVVVRFFILVISEQHFEDFQRLIFSSENKSPHSDCVKQRTGWEDVFSSAARGGGGGEGYSPPPISLPTKMQNKENTTFLALLRLFYALD